ncbi:MAG: sigma-70 family RNA polymerase sigma factor [Ruminococcaceae bacterium]|nr:sigma-70 family RNA polymerase sigma factor [Oscillospiraceae bacterium]
MITRDKTRELIFLAQSGNSQAEETLVCENMGLVYSAATRLNIYGFEREDLIQAGSIGLLKAIRGFDLSKEVEFSTYAFPVITGEIKIYIRDNSALKVSRKLKEVQMRTLKAKNNLLKQLGREPTVSEISELTKDSTDEIIEALEATTAPLSFDSSNNEDERSLFETTGIDKSDENTELLTLKNAIHTLDVQDRKLISLRYFCAKTQSETAKILNMTQVQVSRREKKIMTCLKKYFEE